MVRATVMYPHSAGRKFDFDYHAQKHLPLVGQLLGGALGTHGPALMGDIPNLTDIQPVIQVSEVIL